MKELTRDLVVPTISASAITSSARASSVGGTVRPSALAVLTWLSLDRRLQLLAGLRVSCEIDRRLLGYHHPRRARDFAIDERHGKSEVPHQAAKAVDLVVDPASAQRVPGDRLMRRHHIDAEFLF
jgi:hypothetical protein